MPIFRHPIHDRPLRHPLRYFAHRLLRYLHAEKVLTVSLLLAAGSALFVPPDAEYLGYLDLRVLALLFCLMLLVRGFQSIGLFDLLIEHIFQAVHSSRRLALLLVMLCFFSGMVITNDVALITFVPFAITALELCGQEDLTVRVVVLQTIAANLGSMATPIGNPQNLYLFSVSGMSLSEFLATMLPLTGVSLALILLALLSIPSREIHMHVEAKTPAMPRREFFCYNVLFVLNLLVVFRVLHWLPALLATLLGVLLLGHRQLLRQVDYALLLTFVGFFIFVGNLSRIEFVSSWIASVLQGHEILLAALFSQVCSNVPTAILLSGFSRNYTALLIGVNIGGLGTLIASMASLISFKIYALHADEHPENAPLKAYFRTFTVWNVAGLAILLAFSLLLL